MATTLAVMMVGLCGISSHAAPIVNTFQDTSSVLVVMESSSLSNNGGEGPLTILARQTSSDPVTYGAYGKAIVHWSTVHEGIRGFSLNPSDEQFIFSFTGGESIGSASIVDFAIYFYQNGNSLDDSTTIRLGPLTPVEGNWSYNVYEAAQTKFGSALPSGLTYTVELYIAPTGPDGSPIPIGLNMGYSFESFQATAVAVPESNVVTLFGVAAGVFLIGRVCRSSSKTKFANAS